MADRYWVGGSGTWNASSTAHWSATSGGASGASAPTSSDNVFFDTNSGSSSFTVTLSSATCADLSMLNDFIQITGGTINVYGNINAVYGTSSLITNLNINMLASTYVFVDIRIPLAILTFNGTGTFEFTTSLSTATTVALTSGTIISTALTIYCQQLVVNGSLPKRIQSGAFISFTSAPNSIALLDTSTGSSLTVDVGVNISVSGVSFGYLDFYFGDSVYPNIYISCNGVGEQYRFRTSCKIGTVTFDTAGGSILQLTSSQTAYFGDFVVLGTSAGNLFTVQSSTSGVAATASLSRKLTTIDYLSVRDITGSPANAWYVGANSTNVSGNTNVYFTAAVSSTYYWIAGTGTWYSGTLTGVSLGGSWSDSSGGASNGLIPSTIDSVVFDGSSSATTFTVTTNNALTVVGFSIGSVQPMTFSAGTRSITIKGSFALPASNLTWSSTGAITFSWLSGTNIINTNGFTLTNNVTFSQTGGSWQLASNFTTSQFYSVSHENGVLNINDKTLSAGSFGSNSILTRTLAFGIGNITVTGTGTVYQTFNITGLTVTGTPVVNITNSSASARTISPGTLAEATAPNINVTAGTGLLTISTGSVGSLNFTGFAGSLANTALTVYGGVNTSTGMTLTGGTNTWTFAATTGTKTLRSNGRSWDFPVTFNGAATFQLLDAVTIGPSVRLTTLTAGTLALDTFTYTTGAFSSSAATTRAISFGTGNITVTGTGTVWNTATSSALTVTGTPVVNVVNPTATTTTVSPGTLTEANSISFNFTTGTYALTITAANTVRNLNFSGFAGTLANTALTIYGSVTASSGMTFTAGTGIWTFAATSIGKTITSVGKVLDFPITFNGSGGDWTLADALTCGSARTMTLTAGTLNLSSYTLTTGLFASSNSNVRTIAFGTGNITVSGTGTVWTTGVTTNLTLTGSEVVNVTNATATARTVTPGLFTESDSLSFNIAAGAGALTLTAFDSVKNLNFTGFSGSFAIPTVDIYGSLTFSSTMTVTASGPVSFAASSGSHTITTNGKSFGSSAPTFGSTGSSTATWTLVGAFTTTAAITVTAGTFTTDNYSVTATSLVSSNSNVRAINLGSSTVTLSAALAVNFGAAGTAADLTFNAGTSSVIASNTNGYFAGGSKDFYDLTYNNVTGTVFGLEAVNSANNITVAGRTTAGVAQWSILGDTIINGTLTLSAGTNATMRTFVRSDTLGTTRTLTCAAFSATDADFRDITIAGAAAPVSGTRLGDCKGNSGITFPAAKTVYYRNAASANWNAAWSLTNGGGVDATAFPLAQDTAVFPSSPTPYPSTATTITLNISYNIGTIDMSARTTNTMTLATGTTTPAIYGNWVNGTGTALTGTGIMTFAGRGSQTITSAGKTFTQGLHFNSPGGIVSLQDALTSTGSVFLLLAGTFDAVTYNVTSATTISLTGSVTRTLAIGSGTWTVSITSAAWDATVATNLTVTGTGTLSFTAATSKVFVGGGIQTYPTINQGGNGVLTVQGNNKFANITNTALGVVRFTGGTTNEFVNFNLNGNSTTRLTLGSSNTTQAILKKPSAWNVGVNSLDGGNNTGLTFAGTNPDYLNISYINGQVVAPPVTGSTNFLFFFPM